MDADLPNDAVFDRLLAELETAIGLCAAADRDTNIELIRAKCTAAAQIARELTEPS